MTLERLTIRGVRNLESASIEPSPGVNWFRGVNGAGKTSILEAIHVLARGRSFRSASLSGVIAHDVASLAVHARRADSGDALGVERRRDGWRGRLNGSDCQRISEFAARLPLVLIEPDSHRLIDGGPDRRRQFLDWLLFHVEHGYLPTWQRFARILRQRNAALKHQAGDEVLDALEQQFVLAAEAINTLRAAQVAALGEQIEALGAELGFRLPGEITLAYRPGHPAGKALPEALAEARPRDRERGFSRHGPHRADLVLACAGHPAAVELSRGQQKLLAVLLQIAHLRQIAHHQTLRPLLLLDDPVSELDRAHLDVLLDWLEGAEIQSWVTATDTGRASMRVFHVEQGAVQPVV